MVGFVGILSIQQPSEYRTPENRIHLNTGHMACPDFKWHIDICGLKPFENRTKMSGFQMVWVHICQNTIRKPDFFVRISNGIWKLDHSTTRHLWTVWKPTSPVFGWLLYTIWHFLQCWVNIINLSRKIIEKQFSFFIFNFFYFLSGFKTKIPQPDMFGLFEYQICPIFRWFLYLYWD